VLPFNPKPNGLDNSALNNRGISRCMHIIESNDEDLHPLLRLVSVLYCIPSCLNISYKNRNIVCVVHRQYPRSMCSHRHGEIGI